MKEENNKSNAVFTAAHNVMGFDRYKNVANVLMQASFLDMLVEQLWAVRTNLFKVCDEFEKIENVGPFYSWQITGDLMECGCLPDCTEDDYAKLGKGAVEGALIIFGDADKHTQVELAKMLQTIQESVFEALNVTFPYCDDRKLTVKNIEHALCEFSKFTES
jgi:hypothetical protein